jgi:hypothetical protein
MTTKKTPRKEVASPSKGRARKASREGGEKALQISQRFQQQYFNQGIKGEGSGARVVKTPSYGITDLGAKRTPGTSTPRARAADAAFARNKPMAKKGK